ncbi:MAG: hypothetical protein FWD40_00075 [Treponema sp.]|nr:hypothetical protein [Treponema sp.]
MKFLRITLIAGLMLLILSSGVLTFFYLLERRDSAVTRQQDSFNRIMRDYDAGFNDLFFTEREFDYLNSELDKLEKMAISVESWLSVIKRRRTLASLHTPSSVNYRNTVKKALETYPSSMSIAAIASAALVKNAAINNESENHLRALLPVMTDNSYDALRLSLHVLMGDLNEPQRASLLSSNLSRLVLDYPENNSNKNTSLDAANINIAIIKTLRSDYTGAASDIQNLINRDSPPIEILRFAAEYQYDFGNLQRSAEIFSFINDRASMIRQADALYLAGYTEIARAIWSMLADSQDFEENMINAASLYNLALTSIDTEEKSAFLERLVNMENESENSASLNAIKFGLILYSRLLDYESALFLLQNNASFPAKDFPYIDLEICKRHIQSLILGRQIAETWLLLDRHEKNEDLYKWAAWHFFFQRDFTETKILLDRMEAMQFDSRWFEIYRVIQLMIEGELDRAQDILRAVPKEDASWVTHANLGLILESRRTPVRAIDQYEHAIALLMHDSGFKTAARLQTRIARCFISINRPIEARDALLNALELDPENQNARFELDRFF